MERILLVEDDAEIVSALTEFLRAEGFWVENAAGQKEALQKIREREYDLLLVDISLADGNGYAVCAAARAEKEDIAVIFLTASADEYSTVAGLDMGADDYVVKPFRPRELVSRIRSVLRRRGRETRLEYRGLSVDPVRGKVCGTDGEIFLSALEYRLLLTFFQHRGEILSRSRLLEEIWDASGEFVNDNTLTVYIKRLRDKVEKDPTDPVYIRTIRGLGYKLGE